MPRDSKPADLSEEAVAEWLYGLQVESPAQWRVMARAVRSLAEQKVREACRHYAECGDYDEMDDDTIEAVVAHVMREEAPRG
jgi:hypothetical protein